MKLFEPIKGYTVSENETKHEQGQPIDIKDYAQYNWELTGTKRDIACLMQNQDKTYGLIVTKVCGLDTGYEIYEKLNNLIKQVSPESEVIIEVDKNMGGYRDSVNVHVFIPANLSGDKVANTIYAIGKFNANMGLSVADLVALTKTDRAQQFILTHSGCPDSMDLNRYHVEIKPLARMKYHSNSCGDMFDPDSWNNNTISEDELPSKLQDIFNKYWLEGLCGCQCYLASTERFGETVYGMTLSYETGYDDSVNAFETTKWLQKHDENFYDEAVPRALFYREILNELPYSLTVFIGKGTGYKKAHEVGVFIPCGLPKIDMLHVLHSIEVLTKANKLDKQAVLEKIKTDELFQEFAKQISSELNI